MTMTYNIFDNSSSQIISIYIFRSHFNVEQRQHWNNLRGLLTQIEVHGCIKSSVRSINNANTNMSLQVTKTEKEQSNAKV